MVSGIPRCPAPQEDRVIMGGERVNSNWISPDMAAKKLYFIRSCSKSWSVRSEAVSSSRRSSSSVALRTSY